VNVVAGIGCRGQRVGLVVSIYFRLCFFSWMWCRGGALFKGYHIDNANHFSILADMIPTEIPTIPVARLQLAGTRVGGFVLTREEMAGK